MIQRRDLFKALARPLNDLIAGAKTQQEQAKPLVKFTGLDPEIVAALTPEQSARQYTQVVSLTRRRFVEKAGRAGIALVAAFHFAKYAVLRNALSTPTSEKIPLQSPSENLPERQEEPSELPQRYNINYTIQGAGEHLPNSLKARTAIDAEADNEEIMTEDSGIESMSSDNNINNLYIGGIATAALLIAHKNQTSPRDLSEKLRLNIAILATMNTAGKNPSAEPSREPA